MKMDDSICLAECKHTIYFSPIWHIYISYLQERIANQIIFGLYLNATKYRKPKKIQDNKKCLWVSKSDNLLKIHFGSLLSSFVKHECGSNALVIYMHIFICKYSMDM